jgi:hypothetical protein
MKRALLVLLLAGMVASLDSASATNCPRCGLYQNTTLGWASEPTCSAAMQKAQERAAEEIYCEYDGTCSEQFIVVASCASNGYNWEVAGYVRYRCELDTSVCPEP